MVFLDNTHLRFCHIGVFVDKDHSKLPTLYWLPKLHKRPFQSRLSGILVHILPTFECLSHCY